MTEIILKTAPPTLFLPILKEVYHPTPTFLLPIATQTINTVLNNFSSYDCKIALIISRLILKLNIVT